MKYLVFFAVFLCSFAANAANFSFTGNLAGDDDYQLFNFTLGSASNVTLHTTSYGNGGFDPVLLLFDGVADPDTGLHALITYNDDEDGSDVSLWDSIIAESLEAGFYIIALAQSGHDEALFPFLEDAFSGQYGSGEHNFNGLLSTWSLNIEGVDAASIGASPVPVPAAVWLFGSALMSLFGLRKKA